jgi:hypothetical protein
VFENRVPRKIFGQKEDEVTGENCITRSFVICSMNGEKRKAYRLLVGNPEGKRPLGRPRRRRVDNIRMDLGEVG